MERPDLEAIEASLKTAGHEAWLTMLNGVPALIAYIRHLESSVASPARRVEAPTFDDVAHHELISFLDRVGSGETSGSFAEWPQLRPACRYAVKRLRAPTPATPTQGETP